MGFSGSEEFDPVNRLAGAQFARPRYLAPLNLRALTPYQRALLVIDGTVTRFLEAYTLEPVEICRVFHRCVSLPAPDPWLEAEPGTEVAVRRVVIRGKYSGIPYVRARSMVVLERLPSEILKDLGAEAAGLGRVLMDHRLETRREILWFGREHQHPQANPADNVDHGEEVPGDFIVRAYRIIAGGRPVAFITERFPADPDSLPVDH